MVDVAVDAAVGQQAHEMQGTAAFFAGADGSQIGGVFKEAAVLDGPADAGQVLEDHAAGADVGVAHLAVSHLSLRQAYVQAGSLQLAEGVLGEEIVQLGGVGSLNGVAGDVLSQGEAVHDDKCRWSFHKPVSSVPGACGSAWDELG